MMSSYRIGFYTLFFLIYLSVTSICIGQNEISDEIYTVVTLDSMTVTASKKGFDIEDFINLVIDDQSFYQSFKNLRTQTYDFKAVFTVYDKRGNRKAENLMLAHQRFDGQCRSMIVKEESTKGKYYRNNKKYRYYTSRLYDRLFLTHGKICNTDLSTTLKLDDNRNLKGIERYVEELKRLMFTPGQEINVPFFGKKTAIFDTNRLKYYDFSITSDTTNYQAHSYVFTISMKPEILAKSPNKGVVKYLETAFSKKDLQVLGRRYQFAYNGTGYRFDVSMNIDLTKINERYFPSHIEYEGNWKIPAKKREIVKFITSFDFDVNK